MSGDTFLQELSVLIQIYQRTDPLLHLCSLHKSALYARPKKYTSLSAGGSQASPKESQPEGKEGFGLPCSPSHGMMHNVKITFNVCHRVNERMNGQIQGRGSSFILYWGRSS